MYTAYTISRSSTSGQEQACVRSWDIRSWLFQLSQLKSPAQAFLERFLQKCIADEQNYILKIENVLPPLFRKYLIQEGFVFPGEPWMCGSGYWFKNPQVLHENIELLSV